MERERDELKDGLAMATMEKKVSEQALEEKYKQQIKDRDDAIERLKDMKARLSTKLGGEPSTARLGTWAEPELELAGHRLEPLHTL